MGAIAEGFAAFAKPLVDESDGTEEGLQKALMLGQLCYNLALLPEHQQPLLLDEVRSSLNLNDEEFEAFRIGVVEPMIERHRTMFPFLHQKNSAGAWPLARGPEEEARRAPAAAQPKIDRYAPCPCNSGKKYKFCCGAKGR